MFEILLPAVLEIRRRRPSLVTANLMVPFGWAMILKNKEEDKAQLNLIKGVLKKHYAVNGIVGKKLHFN